MQQTEDVKAPTCGAFAEPYDGLEPSTPPYHGEFALQKRKLKRPFYVAPSLQFDRFGGSAQAIPKPP
jgi:hypothetical protein